MSQFLLILGALIIFALVEFFKSRKRENVLQLQLTHLHERLGTLAKELEYKASHANSLEKLLDQSVKDFEKLQHQKISGDVKLGAKAEALVPLVPQFPFPLETMRFLGAPVDYISFDLVNDRIVFVEVKNGQAKLSQKQQHIKKLIKQKKVEFLEVRVEESGIKFK